MRVMSNRGFSSSKLHLLIQILSLLLVLKVRDELLYRFHHLSLGEVGIGEEGFQFAEEAIHLIHIMTCGLLHHAQSLETLHVDFLSGDVELLVGLLPCGVGGEINNRIFWLRV